jgi:hypothetical protein
MTELISTLYDKHYDTPALIQERDLLESLPKECLKEFISDCGKKVMELRRLEALATDVLSGYGEEV